MLTKSRSTSSKMEQRSPSSAATSNPPNSRAVDSHPTPSAFIYPSNISGMGNCILGPHIPGSSSKKSTATVIDHELLQNTLPSTKKRRISHLDRLPPGPSRAIAASVMNSNKHVRFHDHSEDYQQSSTLTHLVQSTGSLLLPYTTLHLSCAATRPLQIIHASLSSSTFTPTTLMSLLNDVRELLKVLSERQTRVCKQFEPAKARLQQAGMDSMLTDAVTKAQRTESDIKKLGDWMTECDAM